MWNRTWDAIDACRNLPGDFQEEWQHGAKDGCGVHATGASFQNQDLAVGAERLEHLGGDVVGWS